MKIFTIRDNGADYFLPPFTAQNEAVAQRMFIVSMGDSFVFRAQFDLFELGSFDQDTGELEAHEPRHILSGASVSADLDPRLAPQERAA